MYICAPVVVDVLTVMVVGIWLCIATVKVRTERVQGISILGTNTNSHNVIQNTFQCSRKCNRKFNAVENNAVENNAVENMYINTYICM